MVAVLKCWTNRKRTGIFSGRINIASNNRSSSSYAQRLTKTDTRMPEFSKTRIFGMLPMALKALRVLVGIHTQRDMTQQLSYRSRVINISCESYLIVSAISTIRDVQKL